MWVYVVPFHITYGPIVRIGRKTFQLFRIRHIDPEMRPLDYPLDHHLSVSVIVPPFAG